MLTTTQEQAAREALCHNFCHVWMTTRAIDFWYCSRYSARSTTKPWGER